MRRTTTLVATAVLATVAAVLVSPTGGGSPSGGDGGRDSVALPPQDLELAALEGFAACDELLAHVRERAEEIVTPWGLPGGGPGLPVPMAADGRAGTVAEDAADGEEAATADGAGRAGGAQAAGGHSGTNVQVEGVDEPDRVKTDGETLYAITGEVLRVVDVGDTPREIATVDLGPSGHGAQLLLGGDRLLVTASGTGDLPVADSPTADVAMPVGSATTTLTRYDVSDPGAPRRLDRLTVDGTVLSSRLADGTARVVLRARPGNLAWEHPEGTGLRAERAALEANRELIRTSEAADWLPWAVHEDADGTVTEGPAVPCDQVARPAAFSGLGTLSVLSTGLDDALAPEATHTQAVLAGGRTVYASSDHLVVATERWVDWEALDAEGRARRAEEHTTELHVFALASGEARYHASGRVPGRLLDQWALSEHEGHLRVASTVGEAFGGGPEPSESRVTVLDLDDAELTEVGHVDGLGITERIHAVRFLGDVGYVVTFRRIDPLYVVDLSDPTDPTVTGELKMPGYSAYLHPVGEDLLLGVGQDADEQGVTQGVQLSLFDVADPAAPERIDQLDLGPGTSDVEHDHRALLHWAPTGLTVVPVTRWPEPTVDPEGDAATPGRPRQPTSGAVALGTDRDGGLERRAELSHADHLLDGVGDERGEELAMAHQGRITRSVVVGTRLLTLSDAGIGVHDLESLQERGWLPFG